MAKFEVIESFLKQNNVEFKVIDLSGKAVSVEDVMRSSNGSVKREEIIKTLIVKTTGGDFIACVLKGGDRLDFDSVGVERLATKEEVEKVTGVEIGAVCPILIGIPVVIDKKVTGLSKVNMGSGDHLKGLEMNLPDLLKVLPEATIESISI